MFRMLRIILHTLSCVLVSAQVPTRILDPQSVSGYGNGWNVDPRLGYLGFTFPVGTIGGPIPVPVVLRFNATHVVEIATITPPAGASYSAAFHRPAHATLHFGMITAGGSYADGRLIPQRWVLEDGTQLSWTSPAIPGYGTALPAQFGLGALGTIVPTPSSDGRFAIYTTNFQGLGMAGTKLIRPFGFGTLVDTYQVLMDADRARVFQFIPVLNVWVPVLWLDRFNHAITFKWQRSTGPVDSVTVLNDKGKGIQAQWMVNNPTASTIQQDLLRLDWINIQGPTLSVWGYPGPVLNNFPPSIGISSNVQPGGVIQDNPFVLGRPTAISLGKPSGFTPAWPTYFSIPTAVNEVPWAPDIQWTFFWDANATQVERFMDPMGVNTSFTYEAITCVPGTSWGTSLNAVKAAASTDNISGGATTLSQGWRRTVPSWTGAGYTSSSWTTQLTRAFSPADATGQGTLLYTFAGPYQPQVEYFNGVLMSLEVKDWAGVTQSTTTFTHSAVGTDGSLPSDSSVVMTRAGEPSRSFTKVGMDALTGVPQSSTLNVGGALAESVTYFWESKIDQLITTRPTGTTTIRMTPTGGSLPATTQTINYDPTTGRVKDSYLDAGTLQSGTSMGYDAEGRPNSMSPKVLGFSGGIARQGLTYNPDGFPDTLTTSYDDPAGPGSLTQQWSFYTTQGIPRAETDILGITTYRTFDSRGRLTDSSRAGSPSLAVTYTGEWKKTLTQDGNTSIEIYDGFGRLNSRTRFDGVTETYTYDSSGRVINVNEQGGTASRNRSTSFDVLGRPTSQSQSGADPVSFTYFASGRNIRRVAASGATTTSTDQDPWGQVVSSTDARGTTTTTYNELGLIVQVDQLAGGVAQVPNRQFTYNPIGFLTSRTEPETGTTTFSGHNARGLPTTIKEASGTLIERVRALTYDGLGRLRSQTNLATGDFLSFNYSLADPFKGVLLSSSSNSGAGGTINQSFAYGNTGSRLSQETTAWGTWSQSTSYTFDGFGHLTDLNYYPSGRAVHYDYTTGRLTGIKVDNKTLAGLSYDGWGNLQQVLFASGAKTEWFFNAIGGSLGTWSVTPVGDPAESRNYTYDGNLNLKSLLPDYTSLKHDAFGQLTDAAGYNLTMAFVHDGFGNNTSSTLPGQTPPNWWNSFALPSPFIDNRMPPVQSGWATNARGEATGVATDSALRKFLNLGWDGLGRLATASLSDGTGTQSYLYAPLGMRVQTGDTADTSRNRRYSYTSGGLLLSEYAPALAGHASLQAARVFHQSGNAGALSRALGTFAAGDIVTATVWFKAPVGVSGAMAIHDGKAGDPLDSKRFVAMAGNGGWQKMTLNLALQRADNLWIHLYGDMYTSTSASATASTFVDYDDILVIKNGTATVLQDGFESGLTVGTDPLSQTAYYACTAGLASLQTTSGAPDQWKRDVIYAAGRAIAEVDADGIHELHTDHLGTPRVITAGKPGMATALGHVEGKQAYAPFGERITDPAWTYGYTPLTGFTGHVQMDVTGLIYMRGRYYSPAWHRFLNSDQGVDPNQFNQFAYVGGSPLQGIDPSGMEGEPSIRCENGQQVDAKTGKKIIDPSTGQPMPCAEVSVSDTSISVDFVTFIPTSWGLLSSLSIPWSPSGGRGGPQTKKDCIDRIRNKYSTTGNQIKSRYDSLMNSTKADYQNQIANVFNSSPIDPSDAVSFGTGYLFGSSPNNSLRNIKLRPGYGNLGSAFAGLLLTKTFQWRNAFVLQGEMWGVLNSMNSMMNNELYNNDKSMIAEMYSECGNLK